MELVQSWFNGANKTQVAILTTGVIVAVSSVVYFTMFRSNEQGTKAKKGKRKFPPLPPKVSETEFVAEKNDKAAKAFIKSMIEQGFAVIRLDGDDVKEDLANYFVEGGKFFNEQDFDEKEKLQTKHELWSNRKTNQGYIHVKDVKEYLKLGLQEKEYPQYPETLKPAFDKVFASLNQVAKRALELIATHEVDGKTYFSKEIYDHVQKKVDEKSSISLIHYLAAPQAATPSNEHIDTGLLTLIVCAQVPGLQVKDRATDEWLEVETLVDPGLDLFIIMGKKVELLANVNHEDPLFKATVHQVALPSDTERYSLLFFLDVKA